MDSGGGPASPLPPLPPSFFFPDGFLSFVGVVLLVPLSSVALFLRSSEDLDFAVKNEEDNHIEPQIVEHPTKGR